MMDMVFFPFSHVDKNQCRALTTVFPYFQYLPLAAGFSETSPMDFWVKKGVAMPVFTSNTRLKQVESEVAAWLDWAALHKGNQRNLKTLAQEGPCFVDDAQPGAIQSELLARIRQQDAGPLPTRAAAPADPLLFLKIAQLTDAHNAAIDAEIAGLELKQAAVFSELKGEKGELGAALPKTGLFSFRDPGEAMTQARIRAWAACAKEEKMFANGRPLLLITTSSAVFDHLATISTQAINALDIDCIKVHEDGCARKKEWQNHFLGMLEQVVTPSYPKKQAPALKGLVQATDGCRVYARIQVGIFSGADLEKHTGLPGPNLVVCRVAVKA
ncbi:MAG TPA: hypothetical protein VJ943_04500 [Desulfotignum sp.]|nr:hypothetical protein [Desulfotignum sp.]